MYDIVNAATTTIPKIMRRFWLILYSISLALDLRAVLGERWRSNQQEVCRSNGARSDVPSIGGAPHDRPCAGANGIHTIKTHREARFVITPATDRKPIDFASPCVLELAKLSWQ